MGPCPSPNEPDTFLFVGAVNNFDLIICRGVVKCAGAVILKELEVCLSPWVIEEGNSFSPSDFNSSMPIGLMVCSIALRLASVMLSISTFSGSIMSCWFGFAAEEKTCGDADFADPTRTALLQINVFEHVCPASPGFSRARRRDAIIQCGLDVALDPVATVPGHGRLGSEHHWREPVESLPPLPIS